MTVGSLEGRKTEDSRLRTLRLRTLRLLVFRVTLRDPDMSFASVKTLWS